jgi:hypothetical protein
MHGIPATEDNVHCIGHAVLLVQRLAAIHLHPINGKVRPADQWGQPHDNVARKLAQGLGEGGGDRQAPIAMRNKNSERRWAVWNC